MRTRAILLLVVLLGCGAATAFRSGVTGYTRPSEAWLEDQIPARIGDFTFIPSAENPKVSYRMSEETYRQLSPCAIVARIYRDAGRSFDAVVVAADHNDAFHDPRWCFAGQGYRTLSDSRSGLDTPRFGRIPVNVIEIEDAAGKRWICLFLFKGPTKFHAAPSGCHMDFLEAEITRGRPQVGALLRFMTLADAPDAESLLRRFVVGFLEGSNLFSDPGDSRVRRGSQTPANRAEQKFAGEAGRMGS